MAYTDQGLIAPRVGNISDAAANTAAIQAALDAGGRIELVGIGDVYINDSLQIGSNTDFYIGPQLKLKLAPNTIKPLLKNKAYSRASSTVTLSWASGRDCTVNKVAHGYTVGKAVWLAGANQPQYIGVFEIVSVTADTFVIRLERTPTTAPTGTITLTDPDENIRVKGRFDYDWANNNDGTASVNSHAIVLVGINNIDVDVEGWNAYKYILCMSAVRNYRIKALCPSTRSDGVKVYGPAFHGVIVGVDGLIGDDLISFQPLESSNFSGNATSFGDIIDVRGGNIMCRGNSGGQGALVFYANAAGYAMDDIALSGVHGNSSFAGVCVTQNNDVASGAHATFGSISVEDITIRSVRPPAYIKQNASGAFLDGERLNFGIHEAGAIVDATNNSLGSVVWQSNFSLIKNFTISELTLTDATYGAAGNIWAVRLDGAYNNFEIIRPHINAHASLRGVRPNTMYGSGIAGLGDLTKISGGFMKVDHVMTPQSTGLFTNQPAFMLDGVKTQAPTIVNAQLNCDVIVDNCDINGANLGVVRAQGTAVVNLKMSKPTRRGTVNDWVIVSGTPTLNPLSDDIRLDVSATGVLKAQGNRCFNTNAALGTLGVAGPVISDAANWKLQTDPSKVY